MKKSLVKPFKICSICLTKTKNEAKLDGCSHVYCRKCIVEWSKRNNTCPQCRAPFTCIQTKKSRTKVKPPKHTKDNSFTDAIRYFIRYLRDKDFRDYIQRSYMDNPEPILSFLAFCERMLPLVHGANREEILIAEDQLYATIELFLPEPTQ